MPARKQTQIHWTRNRGMNSWDVATDLPDYISAVSMNVVLKGGSIATKRNGTTNLTIGGDTFSGVCQLYRFVPPAGEAFAHVFIVSADSTTRILRISGGATATNLTLKDNVTALPATASYEAHFATLNGKCYIAYDSSVNRLHVYDPTLSTSLVRRVGLATPVASTVADTGSGSYAATIRYYRIQWRVKSGSTVQRQSLLGPSVAFTPGGSGTHARITKPASAGEGETHWAVYGSADDVLFYELSEVVIGTTTYDDNATVANYNTNDPAPDEGAFTPFPSVKYLLSTGERLIGFGVWETSAGDSMTPKNGRVFFSPVLDSSDTDDDERVSNTQDFQGWIDVGRNSGGVDRALAGPLNGDVLVFQSRGIYTLTPTGNADVPFKRTVLTMDLGALSQESTFMGEDEQGRPCVYFVDPIRGTYRYGAAGFQWLGYDLQTPWLAVNHTAAARTAIGAYDHELRAAIFGLALTGSDRPSVFYAFFVKEGIPVTDGVRGGWVTWNLFGNAHTANALAMLPTTFGATMTTSLKPYIGNEAQINHLYRANDPGVTQDDATNFNGYVTAKIWDLGSFGTRKRIVGAFMRGAVGSATITLTLSANYDGETRTSTRTLLTGAEVGATFGTRTVKKFEDAQLASVGVIQVTIGDGSALNQAWTIDDVLLLVEEEEAA